MKKLTSFVSTTCQLALIIFASSSLLLTSCGKKEANAAEVQKQPPTAQPEPTPVVAPPVATSSQDANDNRRMTAIFVISRDKKLEDKVSSMEDYVTSQVGGKGYSIINRETVVDATKNGKVEEILSQNTSAQRLAQGMGADYLLVITLNSLIIDSRHNAELGTDNVFNTLKATYKIIDGAKGGTLAGGTGTVEKKKVSRLNEDSGVIDDLLNQASIEMGKRIDKAVIAAASKKPDDVEITIVCGMTDLVGKPISIPDLRVNDQGIVVIGKNNLEMQSLDVSVAVNGFTIGSAPGKFKIPRGNNKLRLSREGFNALEENINLPDDQTYKAALQMSADGYKRWMETTTFLFAIKAGEKLTDGTVKMMEGFAQTLRQSGYRVDAKTDIKADIQTKGKSLFDGATLKAF